MIDHDGAPTDNFKDMVAATVEQWMKADDQIGNSTQFIVMAVQEKDGRKSYWGLIDCQNTPREDIYIEVERRFYCAYRTLGQDSIFGVGILDILAVLDRVDLPRPPMPPLPPDHPFYH